MIDLLLQAVAAFPPGPRPVAAVPLFTAPEIIQIIGAITTSALAIIAAVNSHKTGGQVKAMKQEATSTASEQNQKLDVLQEQSNGVQTSLRAENTALAAKVERLYTMIAAMAPNARAIEQAAAAVPKVAEVVASSPPPPEAERLK